MRRRSRAISAGDPDLYSYYDTFDKYATRRPTSDDGRFDWAAPNPKAYKYTTVPLENDPNRDDTEPYQPKPKTSLFEYFFGPNFFQYGLISWFLWLPYVVLTWFLYLVFLPLVLLIEAWNFFWSNLHWILLFLVLFFLSVSATYYYDEAITSAEHAFRCRIKPYWIDSYKDLFAALTKAYEYGVCWWNALVGINRVISGPPIVRMLSNCDNGFTIYDWIVLTSNLVVDFVKPLLIWAFVEQPMDEAVSTYPPFQTLYTVWIPKTNDGVVCACKSSRFVTLWFARVMNTTHMACMSQHLVNFAAGTIQVPVNFMFDTIRLITNFKNAGLTSANVTSTLIDPSSANSTLPTLSKSELKERLGAFAVYAGLFLNRGFTVTYCHFKSEIDAMGDDVLAEAEFQTCILLPENNYDLFCSLGPITAAYFRLMSLSTKLLINLPTIAMDYANKPPGPRYFIDQLWDVETDYVFDTLRPPQQILNYANSVNFPTPAVLANSTNPPPSSIIYGTPASADLYGLVQNTSCALYDNSRKQVPCAECGRVADYDLSTCSARTGAELDRLLEPFLGFKMWTPTLGIVVPSFLSAGSAAARFLSGFVAHIFNMDRMLSFLANQNHYDHFFDALLGKPYQFGGVLVGVREGLIEFDERLYCLANLLLKPVKSGGEGVRILVTAICRFLNTVAGTPEPGLASYVCISFSDCLDLERAVSWIRRPRTNLAYDPTYSYIPPSMAFEPAFLDCMCWLLDLEFLSVFTENPPTDLPEFCCFPHFFARWSVENVVILIEFWLTVLETAITLIDSQATLRISTIEWAACIDYYRCTNFGAILADVEDLLNCGCLFIQWLNDLLSDAKNEFPCLCDFLSAAVQWWTNLERSGLEFTSCYYDILYCLANDWPTPHCTTNLHTRFTIAFTHLDSSFNAMSGMFGSIGCVLGLPWVGLEVDCLGTRYTWPRDHSTCNTSAHGMGVCTMADRLRMVVYYVHQIFLVFFKYFYNRVQTVIDVGFAIIAPSSLTENTISLAIMNFLLEIRDPFFGRSNKLLFTNFDSVSQGPYPVYTGINITKLNATIAQYQNVSNISGYNYQDPPSATVYDYTFNYTTISGLGETTGLMQAAGLTLSCLLGPPTTSCVGPLLYAPSTIEYNGGCLGDPAGAIADGIRDVYTMIVKFVGLGLNVIETLFMNPDQFGEAIRLWINSFFQLLMVILESIDRLVTALLMVIVEVARFVFGDGIAEMLKFMLTFIANVISLFAWVIKFLLAPFTSAFKRGESAIFETTLNATFSNINNRDEMLKEMRRETSDLSKRFADAYAAGYETIWLKRTPKEGRKRDAGEEKEKDDDNVRLWKRLNFEQFTKEQAQNMTDDTFCKKALTELTPVDGYMDFSQMSLANECIWKACFFAYSLPNELYAYSGGKLSMDADTFYNLDKLTTFAMNGLSMFGDYLEWSGQTGKYVSSVPNPTFTNPISPEDGSVNFNYTETVKLPQAVLDIIAIQLEHRRNDVAADLLSKFTIVAGETPVSEARKRFDVYDAVSDGVVDWSELGRMECIPYIKEGITGCWDVDKFEAGFNIVFGSNTDRSWYGTESGLDYDAGKEFVYNIFNNTNATIYTNLAGFAYVYVSKTNTTYPVVDGKISFEIQNTTLSDYSRLKYPSDTFTQFVADGATKMTQEKSMNDYLIMLHRIKGNYTPSSASDETVNVTEIIQFYRDAVYGSRNETAPTTDAFGNTIKKRFYEKVQSASKGFSNVMKTYIKSNMMEGTNAGRSKSQNYYGSLNEKIRTMKSDEFGKTFFDKFDKDEFKHGTSDSNVMWIDALVNENEPKWRTIVDVYAGGVQDYAYESTEISMSARTYYASNRYALIKDNYDKAAKGTKKSFDWNAYLYETLPQTVNHWYASSFTGKSVFDAKSQRVNVYGTPSLREAVRIDDKGTHACGYRLNEERDVRSMVISEGLEERFVLTFDYPVDISSSDLSNHTIDVSKPLKKLYNILYLEPSLHKHANKEDKLKRYDPNAGIHAHLNRFGPFDRYLMHPDLPDAEHRPLSVVKLGFDAYEYKHVNRYAEADCYGGFAWEDTMMVFKRRNVVYSDPYDNDPHFETKHATMYFNLGHAKNACEESIEEQYEREERMLRRVEENVLSSLKSEYEEKKRKIDVGGDRIPKNRIEMFFSSFVEGAGPSLFLPVNVTVDANSMLILYEIYKGGQSIGRFAEVHYDALIFDVEKCFVNTIVTSNEQNSKKREAQESKNGAKYKSLYDFLSNVYATRVNKTVETFYNKTSSLLSYVQAKHRETYAVGKVPSIDQFILTTSSWNTKYLADALGYAGEKTERDYTTFAQTYLDWSGYFDFFGDYASNSKRTHQPKLIRFCLPQAPGTPDVTTCSNCRGCESDYCSACDSCGNCTIGFGGFYDCEFCANCRVNGPLCQGRCFQCTDCVTEQPCLDCRLVEYFLTKMIYYVNYCVETLMLNNTDFVLRPPANVSFIETIPYDGEFPEWSDYGFFRLLQYLFGIVVHLINSLFGIDVVGTVSIFSANLNFDPFVDSVGLFYLLWDFFFAPCNLDVHLQCTFGLGLYKGLAWSTGTVAVFNYAAWFFNPNVAGLFGAGANLLSRGSIVTFWLGLTAYLAWYYKPRCFIVGGVTLITNLLGWNILPAIYAPKCAMTEINTLLLDIFDTVWSLPATIVTNGVNSESACNIYAIVTDCSKYGYVGAFDPRNAFTTVGYIGQRFFPESLEFWFTDYLNRTALGYNTYLSNTTGPLAPFYAVDFDITVPESETGNADFCFYINLPFTILLFAFIGFVFYAIFRILSLMLRPLILDPLTFLFQFPGFRYIFSYDGLPGSGARPKPFQKTQVPRTKQPKQKPNVANTTSGKNKSQNKSTKTTTTTLTKQSTSKVPKDSNKVKKNNNNNNNNNANTLKTTPKKKQPTAKPTTTTTKTVKERKK